MTFFWRISVFQIPPKSASSDDQVDIESNLLRPAGVQLQPATYTVKIYKAEDVPRSKLSSSFCHQWSSEEVIIGGQNNLLDFFLYI